MKHPGRNFNPRVPADVQKRMCTRKRRYRTQGDALDAALIVGSPRELKAYLCPLCGHWHLSSAPRD